MRMIWSGSTVDSRQRSHNQSETAEDGKNGFLKTFFGFCQKIGYGEIVSHIPIMLILGTFFSETNKHRTMKLYIATFPLCMHKLFFFFL